LAFNDNTWSPCVRRRAINFGDLLTTKSKSQSTREHSEFVLQKLLKQMTNTTFQAINAQGVCDCTIATWNYNMNDYK
jgi:hypothetical protein